jgi:ABC-type antimicrobial peptide transport system permease subunit
MKIQHLIASVIAFIVVLMVGIYVLHFVAVQLFPDPDINTWITYGIPEILGLILAIIAAYYAGKMSAKMQTTEK